MVALVQMHWGRVNRSKSITFMVLADRRKAHDERYFTVREIYKLIGGAVPLQTLKNSLIKWAGYARPYLLYKKRHVWQNGHIITRNSYKINAKGIRYWNNVPETWKLKYRAFRAKYE